MEIKGVIFDLDGTLIDTIEDIADANNAMLKSYGYPQHSVDKYITWIGNGAKKLVEKSLPDNTSQNGSLDEFINLYTQFYFENLCVKTKLYKGVAQLLDFLTLSNIPFSINTNKPQSLSEKLLKHYFKNWSIQTLVGHRTNLPHKPHPQGALLVANEMGLNPSNILFIGDSLVDIQTAKNADITPLGVSWGYGNPIESDKTDYPIVDNPQEIIDYIKATNKI